MSTLTGSQRRFLRGLANPLKPVIQIGKNGLTAQVMDAINAALDDHELIKVRFLELKEEKKTLSTEIAGKTQSELAGLIGHIAIFYRKNTDPEKRKINLPEKSVEAGK
jgi:RNA-binding protein